MSKLEEILLEYNKLEIKNQLDYDKFYLYSIITHSTAIEGSTITQAENEALSKSQEEEDRSYKPIKSCKKL